MTQAKAPWADPQEPWKLLLDRGIAFCRKGDWDRGLPDLVRVATQERRPNLPSTLYSYLGYGIARFRGEVQEGLRLCQHAVKLEFYQPDNLFNLARTHLIAGNRREAYAAMSKGLRLDVNHQGLQDLVKVIGRRAPAVLPFLSRGNLLNRFLGRFRHRLKKDFEKQPPPVRPTPARELRTDSEGRQEVPEAKAF